MKQISIQTGRRTEFVDITGQVQSLVSQADMSDGTVTVFVPHTTAGVTINENADPDVLADLETVLDKMIPWRDNYRHMEGNTAAHMKASLMGSSVRVLVEGGNLQLGTWQSIFFSEFDGPRSRRIWVGLE